MRSAQFWIDKLLTRERFARPFLNAALFAWLLATVDLIAHLLPGYFTVVTRWFLSFALFAAGFYLYVYWENVEEKAQGAGEKAADAAGSATGEGNGEGGEEEGGN